MLARPQLIVRSHPGRAAAVAVAVLLTAGAAVGLLSGDAGHSGGAENSLSSKASEPTAGGSESTRLSDSDSFGQDAYSTRENAVAAGGAPAPASQAPVSPGVGPSGLGGQPVPDAVAAGTSRIVKNATLEIGLKDGGLGDGYQRAVDAAAAAGGWVQASQTGTDQATLTLRIPSEKLQGVIGTIRGLGTVKSVSESGEDVTAEFVDLEARITHWRAQAAVFVGLMGKAQTISETIQIQQQLSTIQEQIEQLEGRRKLLDGKTSFSTLRLSLLEEGAVAKVDTEPKAASTLSRAWERAGGAALAVFGGTIVVLGALVPLAAVVGIPAWLAAVLLRRRGRRQEAAPAGL